jgi:hypothetical protein
MEQLGEDQSTRAAARMRSCLPLLQQSLKTLWLSLTTDSALCLGSRNTINGRSNKFERLLELLDEIFTSNHRGYRGIVFVEQVALVSPLASQNDEYFENSSSLTSIHSGAIAGTGAQTNNDRQVRLDSFRLGETQILVATATLEEGVDVSECAFVIRFNALATTKAHIQGSGRARHSNAHVYYFENNPDQERQKEGIMTSVARDVSLQLSGAQLKKSSSLMNVAVDDRHPYPFGCRRVITGVSSSSSPIPGEVSVYNCKQILNQYCSMTLGQSISPKAQLYEYQAPADTAGFVRQSQQQRKVLLSVRYPTPSGWQVKNSKDYTSFWSSDINLDLVFGEEERIKKKSGPEREEMLFVYIVVVELRERGFLNAHNKPCTNDADFLFHVKRNCPVKKNQQDGSSLSASVIISLKNNRLY